MGVHSLAILMHPDHSRLLSPHRCLPIALLGIVLMIAAREVEYSYGVDAYAPLVLAMRSLNSVSTIVLLYALFMYNSWEFHLETLGQGTVATSNSFYFL